MRLQAVSIALGLCPDPECRSVHLDFLDGDDRVIANATINVEHVPDVIKKLQSLAYVITTGEKPRG